MLVGIAYDEADRTACRLPLEDTAEQFHLVGFVARCCNLALSGTTAVQFLLDKVKVDVNACRHTIDDATHSLTVTLAKGRQSEYLSKCVHRSSVF